MWPPDPDPDPDPEPAGRSQPGAAVPGLRALLPARAFLCSLKGRLLLAESGLSFITFVCYVASSASAFLTAPLLEFLLALFFLFADAMQLNDKWQGLCWPMMDFLRCVTAALIYFAISITAVAKYSDGASKAAGGPVPANPSCLPKQIKPGGGAGVAASQAPGPGTPSP
ncbi:CKLF like MARVEL transmembrane domain containing 3 [Phyllostomus discolor]|uniref:CKLF like MARVEL transmembrane domain containing 3 n=1 Tax=Phyllostomus discolor TaxID=89673 RepID=A0A834DEG5_9CHIR|nr:CKLF like MARVEL transmembrane domain containing 3 [Phyllostomus discolor]